MNEQTAASQTGITALPQTTGRGGTLTRPRSAAEDPDTRYVGAISLAAALGGILLGVETRSHSRNLKRAS